jgi:hypothetical protein
MEFLLFWAVIGALVGALIGSSKGRSGEGAILGLILGPIGWLAVALGPDERPKCSHCGGDIVAGFAKCKHCGSEIATVPTRKSPVEKQGGSATGFLVPLIAIIVLAVVYLVITGSF